MIDGLVAFLRARLDEDEAAANAGARRVGMPWRVDPEPWDGDTGIIDDLGRVGSTGGRYAAEHIVRHDPARALREIQAMRAIAALYDCASVELSDSPDDPKVWGWARAAHVAAHDIATIWSGHPDYRPEWKP
jgi:Family of unknown function (DUF6221)